MAGCSPGDQPCLRVCRRDLAPPCRLQRGNRGQHAHVLGNGVTRPRPHSSGQVLDIFRHGVAERGKPEKQRRLLDGAAALVTGADRMTPRFAAMNDPEAEGGRHTDGPSRPRPAIEEQRLTRAACGRCHPIENAAIDAAIEVLRALRHARDIGIGKRPAREE